MKVSQDVGGLARQKVSVWRLAHDFRFCRVLFMGLRSLRVQGLEA